MIDDPFDLFRLLWKLLMLMLRILLYIPELFVDLLFRSPASRKERREAKRSVKSEQHSKR